VRRAPPDRPRRSLAIQPQPEWWWYAGGLRGNDTAHDGGLSQAELQRERMVLDETRAAKMKAKSSTRRASRDLTVTRV
jgi:hypothetical protein